MGREEIRAMLLAELQQAEQQLREAQLHYAQVKKAYEAMEDPPPRSSRPRENLKKLVLEALESFVPGNEFTVQMLFERMQRPDIIYENARPRLVAWLQRLVTEGRLEQTGRGRFCRRFQRN